MSANEWEMALVGPRLDCCEARLPSWKGLLSSVRLAFDGLMLVFYREKSLLYADRLTFDDLV